MERTYSSIEYKERFKTKTNRNGCASNLKNIPLSLMHRTICSVDGHRVAYESNPRGSDNRDNEFGGEVWELGARLIHGCELPTILSILQNTMEAYLPSPGLGHCFMGAPIAVVSICIMHL